VCCCRNCSEPLAKALDHVFGHVQAGRILLTLATNPTHSPEPSATITNTYSFAVPDIDQVGIAFVVDVDSPLTLTATVPEHSSDPIIGPVEPVPLHEAAQSLHLYRVLDPQAAAFVTEHWRITHDPRVLPN